VEEDYVWKGLLLERVQALRDMDTVMLGCYDSFKVSRKRNIGFYNLLNLPSNFNIMAVYYKRV